MYFWKCWRDTRGAFFVVLGSLLAVALFLGVTTWKASSAAAAAGTDWPLWRATAEILARMIRVFVPLAGFALGAAGVGEEFARGSAGFLLTRPRPRRYFVWAGWITGMAELTAVILAGITLGHLALAPASGFEAARAMREALLFSIVAAVLYGLTLFMTQATRSARHGMNSAIAIAFCYIGLAVALHINWEITLASPFDLYKHASNLAYPFPAAKAAGWGAVALAFPAAAQWLLERAET